MKKFTQFLLAISVALLATSCFAPRTVATTSDASQGPKKRELNEVQQYALDAPSGVLRAAGEYRDIEEFEAHRMAAAIARNNLALNISAQVRSGIEIYRNSKNKASVTASDSQQKKEIGGRADDEIVQLCEMAVAGAREVKYSIYDYPNGEIMYYVCVEADAKSVAKYLANNEKVQDLISEDEAAEIEFDRDQFRAFLEEQFNKR